jgi:lysophospholipid acyltransferase (LPLAT)-like uncharacterized protein
LSEDAPLDRKTRWLIAAGLVLLRMLALTWRIRYEERHLLRELREARSPIIFAFWHGQMLPLLWVHRGEGVAVLISEHRDGEIVARVAQSLGLRVVRGSTSRGAGRALIGVVRELVAGREVAITPDGPRGPARSFAPGALIASQRANAPILAISVAARRCWRLKSWDRFMIPKPFTRVTVSYAGPRIATAPTPRDAAALAHEYQLLLDENTARAESL